MVNGKRGQDSGLVGEREREKLTDRDRERQGQRERGVEKEERQTGSPREIETSYFEGGACMLKEASPYGRMVCWLGGWSVSQC